MRNRLQVGKTTARWVAESLLILISVAVGFATAEFRDYRENRDLAATVLRSVREEVESNLAVLDPLLTKHRDWQEALARVDLSDDTKSAYDILFEARPGDVTIGLPLSHAAWNTAVSSGALKLFNYDVAAALSEIYGYQELMTANHSRFVGETLYAPSTFDPGNRVASVRMMWAVMVEIAGNEEFLRDLYRKHLPLLRQASPD